MSKHTKEEQARRARLIAAAVAAIAKAKGGAEGATAAGNLLPASNEKAKGGAA